MFVRGLFICKFVALVALHSLLYCSLEAQTDGHYSLYMKNKQAVNPAYSGFASGLRISGISKRYWSNLEGAPQTTYFLLDMPLKILNGGVGLRILSDQYGLWSAQSVELMYSYHLKFREGVVGLGLQLGARDHSFDGSRASTVPDFNGEGGGSSGYHQGGDPAVPNADGGNIVVDFTLGACYEDEMKFLSLAIHHLATPEVKFDGGQSSYLARTLFLSGGVLMESGMRGIDFKPSAMLRSDFSTWQMDINMLLVFNDRFWGGLGYRWGESMIIKVGVDLKNGLEVGYAYDMGLSKLVKPGAGSQELFLSYNLSLDFKRNKNKYRSIRVP